MISTKNLLMVLNNLEQWRYKYNQNNFGYGVDQYCAKKHNYAESYAKFMRGYIRLYKITKQKKFLKKATKCKDWLIANSNNYLWGLPIKYKNIPANTPYLITTSFVGIALQEYNAIKKEKELDLIIKNIGKAIFKNFYDFQKKHLKYSELHDYYIPNANSIALEFLIKANIKNDKIKIILNTLLKYENKDGSWYYSDKSNQIDCLHSCYTTFGLLEYYKKYKDSKIKNNAMRAIKFIADNFYKNSGSTYWLKLHDFNEISKIGFYQIFKDFIKKIFRILHILKKYDPPNSLWGYSASIIMFSKATKLDFRYYEHLQKITKYVVEIMRNSNNSFKYKNNDSSIYIRHQAHIFDSLTQALIIMVNINDE